MKIGIPDISFLVRVVASRWGIYCLMIAGLSLSFCAAVIIGLYVYDELTFDRFLPSADRTYLVSSDYGPPGQPLVESDSAPAGMSRWMRSDLPAVQAISRLYGVEWPMMTARRKVKERFYWADANIFQILNLPAVQGDLKTALIEPGSLVLTQRMARAYFGRDDVVGQTITTKDNIKFHVTAVLKDLPENTHLGREIFVSGRADYSMLSTVDHNWNLLWPCCYTYVTFKPGTSVSQIQNSLLDITRRHWQGPNNIPTGFKLIRLPDLHLHSRSDGQMKPRGHWDFILALIVVAVAIVSQASINFSGLILAETNERGHDMSLRKALGAQRNDLIAPVLQEALCVTFVSALIALAATERLLPELNKALGLSLSLWAHPFSVLSGIVVVSVLAGGASGLVPALIVSKPFSGSKIAHRTAYHNEGSGRWSGWVIAQLSLVIVLLISSATMSQQWIYATREALHFNGENVIMIKPGDDPSVNAAFLKDIRSLHGVEAVARSFGAPTTDYFQLSWINQPGGHLIAFTRNSVSPDFFQVYRVPFLAGHNLTGTYLLPEAPKEIVINKSAAQALGFANPKDVIGKDLEYDTDRTHMRSRIVGVVPDIRFATVYEPIPPMIFDNYERYFSQFNIRLQPSQQSQTVEQIDQLWNRDSGEAVPLEKRFFNEYLMQQYTDLHQQIQVFTFVSCLAIMVSTLGLTGLSIFLTRQKVREIAIRRALGATFIDIFVQRLTPFFKPLLYANIIAWPVAWFSLSGWLNSFADHISLSITSFVGAGAISVLFAIMTIAANSALTGRDTSTSFLRHE